MSDESTVPELARIIEALLFASQKPVSVKEIIAIFKSAADAAKEDPMVSAFAKVKEAEIRDAIATLPPAATYEVRETVSGWQLVTRAEYSPWLRQLYPENRSARLSAPALETLAIIAYRQPITRADIEAVRGVAVDGVMQTLLDRSLVKIAGRAEVPGRPLLYETTGHFMEHFGLKDLEELPNSGELRRIALPTATPPPETPADAAATPEPAEAAPEPEGEPDLEPAAMEAGPPSTHSGEEATS